MRREIAPAEAGGYVAAQLAGVLLGVLAAHLMFDQALLQVSAKVRTGPSQWQSEWVATFGLVAITLLTLGRASAPAPAPAEQDAPYCQRAMNSP